MKTVVVSLTEGEALALCRLIDLAVKSGGLNVAQAAIVLNDKIVEAAGAAGLPTNLTNGKATEVEVTKDN